jgi:hypothetical protein
VLRLLTIRALHESRAVKGIAGAWPLLLPLVSVNDLRQTGSKNLGNVNFRELKIQALICEGDLNIFRNACDPKCRAGIITEK